MLLTLRGEIACSFDLRKRGIRMLPLSGDEEVLVSGDSAKGESVRVETKYSDYTVDTRMSVSGQAETWTRLVTRPAAEVALLTREPEPRVFLMQNRRLESDPLLTRFPGGYLRDGIDTQTLILQKSGIRFETGSLNSLGQVQGHSEIITPIDLYYTFDWHEISAPPEGTNIFQVSFSHLIGMAMRRELENVSSFSLAAHLYFLQQTGQLLANTVR